MLTADKQPTSPDGGPQHITGSSKPERRVRSSFSQALLAAFVEGQINGRDSRPLPRQGRKQQAGFTSSLTSRQPASRPLMQWRMDGRKTGSKQVPLRAASSEEEDEVHEDDLRQGNMELGLQW